MSDELSAPMMVFPRRNKPGRPSTFNEPTYPASTRLPLSAYDQLAKQADRRGMSLSRYINRILIRDLKK